jgi:hypothetical protein
MIKTRVEPLDRDIAVLIRDDLSPAAMRATLAGFARDALAEAQATNRSTLGAEPRYETFVDGRKGGTLESVQPNGVIVFEFDLVRDVVAWITEQLDAHSPFKTGRYKRSHTIFADGVQVDGPKSIAPDAREIIFVPSVAHARRLEHGWSKQAPNGVYQVVAALARSRFGNIARIAYSFRALFDVPDLRGDQKMPAIVLTI